jgi:large subunit ribosomal protein L9
MKVILNRDLATLGEEGDVKEVARGYARNYLFPRGIAFPHTERIIALFEARKGEIESHKAQKRQDAAGVKERIEALEMTVIMPAGVNGKLYGAVTTQTIVEELGKAGFDLERKRIEIPGNTIKSVGKFRVAIRLYGNTTAEFTVVVQAQEVKVEEKPAAKDPRHDRKRRDRFDHGEPATDQPAEQVAAEPQTETEATAEGVEAAGGTEEGNAE